MENNPNIFQHVFSSLEGQVGTKNCLLHEGCSDIKCSEPNTKNPPDFMVSGSPCNPFSLQRKRRFEPGNVASHGSFSTTMKSIIKMYQRQQPRIGLFEQVKGFDLPMEKGSEETPFQRHQELWARVCFNILVKACVMCNV